MPHRKLQLCDKERAEKKAKDAHDFLYNAAHEMAGAMQMIIFCDNDAATFARENALRFKQLAYEMEDINNRFLDLLKKENAA